MTDLLVDVYDVDGLDFDSDSIQSTGYDRENKVLYVQFHSGETIYAYDEVEESTYNLFRSSPSLNRFWRNHISGNYTSTKYEDGDMFYRENEVEVNDVTKSEEVTVSDASGLSRFSVKWVDANGSALSGAPEYQATDVDDALRQFYAQLGSAEAFLGAKVEPVVKAVTHYFD